MRGALFLSNKCFVLVFTFLRHSKFLSSWQVVLALGFCFHQCDGVTHLDEDVETVQLVRQ